MLDLLKHTSAAIRRERLQTAAWRLSSWWAAVLLILAVGGLLRLSTYQFSLPYIDHPDEPSLYLKALEWRGLFDLPKMHEGYPPAYLGLNALLQIVLESIDMRGLEATMPILRLLAVLANLATLLLIALAARLAAGELAGLLAGLAWAVAPIVLENGVLATPDPFVYLTVVLSLWLAMVALHEPARRHWCLWSTVAGLLAMLFKYPAIVALAPGGMVALLVFSQDRRRGLRYLAIQLALTAAVVLWLLLVYRVARDNYAQARLQGMANLFWLEYFINRLYYTVLPLRPLPFVLVSALGLAAFALSAWRGGWRAPAGQIGLCLVLFFGIPWLASSFTPERIRDVLPAMAIGCVLFGVASVQIARTMEHLFPVRRAAIIHRGALLGLLGVFVFIPQLADCLPVVQDRARDDWRTHLRRWADLSLEAGLVLVDRANHKTFNPFWSGVEGRQWFDWLETEDLTAHSPETWRRDYGASYMVLPLAAERGLQESAAGRAYLGQMLHLRTFAAPPSRRGPEVAVYRLWRMSQETQITFDERIRLLGYDLDHPSLAPGEALTLRFYWQASRTPPIDYSVYIHLVPIDSRAIIAQADGTPALPDRPTSTWDAPDETLIGQPFRLLIPPDTPPGTYRLLVGLYDFATGERLRSEIGDDHVVLSTLQVE